MPYSNEHSCRLINPDEFVRFFRKHVKDNNDIGDYKATGKSYDLIIGYRKDNSSDVQANRYPKDKWTAEQAKKHCKAHDGILFEPATNKDNLNLADEDPCCGAIDFNDENDPERELRSFEVEIRVSSDPNAPSIDGTAAVYNKWSQDLGGFREMIEPGFFEEVLKGDTRALWNHNDDLILGRTRAGTLTLEDTERGLNVHIKPPDTQAGRDAVISIERRDVTQMSFAFTVKHPGGDEWIREKDGTLKRILKRGGASALYDVSPVIYPAYQSTSVYVRSMIEEMNNELTGEGEFPEPDDEHARRLVRIKHAKRKLEIQNLR